MEEGDIETGQAVSKGKSQGKEQTGGREADAGEVGWQTGEVGWEGGGRAGRELGRQESAARAGRRQGTGGAG